MIPVTRNATLVIKKDKSKIMQGKSKSIIGKFPYIPIILGGRFIEIF